MSSKNLIQASKPNKVHYRMYKSGRQWLFASMAVVTVGSSLLWGNQAHAATTTPTNDESAGQTAVNSTTSASSTVVLHESTSTTSQVSSSSAVSGDRQSSTSATSQVSQASQTSQVTNESSSASQPAISDGQSSQSSANTTSQASQISQATSESSNASQSAVGAGQLSQAPANSIDAANQAKSVTPSQASEADNQSIVAQPIVSLTNEQADSGTLVRNLMVSDVTTANKMIATRASLLKDVTPDSTFTWSIDDTGTTLTLNGGTPTESLYTMLTDAQRKKIEHIVIANPVTIIDDVGAKFFAGFTYDETITGLENIDVSQAVDLSSMFNQLGNYGSETIAINGLAGWNVSKVTTFEDMFFYARIESVDIEDWEDVKNVQTMNNMFEGTNLTSLNLSQWQISQALSSMENFISFSTISSLNLNTWRVADGIDINKAFTGGPLTEITLNSSFMDFSVNGSPHFYSGNVYPYDNEWIDEKTQQHYTATELEDLFDTGNGTTDLYKLHIVGVQGLTAKDTSIYPNMAIEPMDLIEGFIDTDNRSQNLSYLDAKNFKLLTAVDTSKVGEYRVEVSYTDNQGNTVSVWSTLHIIQNPFTYTAKDQTFILDAHSADDNISEVQDTVVQMVSVMENGQPVTFENGLGLFSDGGLFEGESLTRGTYHLVFTATDSTDNIAFPIPVTLTLIKSKEKLALSKNVIIRPDGSITAADLFQTALDGYGDSLIDTDGQLSSAVTLVLPKNLDLSKPNPGKYTITATYTDDGKNVVTDTQTIDIEKTKENFELTNDDQPVSIIAGPAAEFDPIQLVVADSVKDGFGNLINASQLQYDYYDLNNQPVTLDLKHPGQYQLKISYQDSAGNIISKTVQVNLNATKLKVILTTDSKGIVINDADFDPTTLIETAVDENGDPLIPTVVNAFARMARLGGNQLLITNHVDVTKAGTYAVDFSYTDVAGNVFNQSVAVTVYAPATFTIQPTQSITQGEVFDPRSLFVSGTGVNGANLTAADLTYDLSGVDFTKAGVYQLPVSYKDQYGKLTTINSELTIKAQPVVSQAKITLNSIAPIVAAANQTFDPTQVVNTITTATGEKMAVTDPAVMLISNVDPTKPGTYQVRVSYAGVSATATITVIAATNPGDDGNSGTTTPTTPDDGHHGGTTTPTNPDDNGGTTTPTTPDTGNGNNTTVSDNNGGTTMPTVNKPGASVKTPATANQSKPVVTKNKKQATNQPVTNVQPAKASLVATDAHVKTGSWQASSAGVMLAKAEKTTVTSTKVDLKAPTSKQPTHSQPVSGELPQTNDRLSVVGIVGATLVGLLGLFGLASHRKF